MDAGAGKEHIITPTTSIIREESSVGSARMLFMAGPVLLLGAPGVGKGTQSQKLMAELKIPQISTGDILRANIANGTELGRSAKVLMDKGQLVPDDLVNSMVRSRLSQDDVRDGFILDGFPRTLAQAAWLDEHLRGAANALPLVAVKMQVANDELLRRIAGRRSCPVCKRIYNVYSHPPTVEGICDYDATELIQRSDDTETAFYERMRAYDDLTKPVIEHYQRAGRFREVNGAGSVQEVEARIILALRELRGDVLSAGLAPTADGI